MKKYKVILIYRCFNYGISIMALFIFGNTLIKLISNLPLLIEKSINQQVGEQFYYPALLLVITISAMLIILIYRINTYLIYITVKDFEALGIWKRKRPDKRG